MTHLRHHLVSCVFAALLFSTLQVTRAAETKPEEKKKKWESVASLGVTLTRGNSETFLATASIGSTRKWSHDEMLLGLNGGYGESTANVGKTNETTSRTDAYIKGFAQWNHIFSDSISNFYGGIRLNGDHDAIADLDYRFTVSPLVGYYFLKQTNAFIALETGPSWVYEKQGGTTKDYFAIRVGERGEYKFKNGARIWESVEWFPQVDDFNNWILNAELGVSAPITKALDVRLVIQDTYDNEPAPERKKNDFKLIAAIGFRF